MSAPEDLAARGAAATWPEIQQQPEAWRDVARIARAESARVRAFLDPLLAQPGLRVVLTGAGTSAFAGEVLAPALARRLGRRVDAVATTDIVASPRETFAEDVPTLLVSFARSGDSPESATATALAGQCLSSVAHLVLTCNPDGRLALEHAGAPGSLVLLTPAGTNDRGFAMTSSFTSMLLLAWLVLTGADDADVLAGRLAGAAETVLAGADRAEAIAARGYDRVVYLGSGALGGLAREAALKLLELTAGGVVSYFDTALGFRHGPKAVLRAGTLAVVFRSNDPYTGRYDDDIAAELRRALGPEDVLVLTTGGGDDGWTVDGLADVDDVLLALPYVVVAQLLALRFSLRLGRTPDNPFPDGEVNRVVQGVTVHPLPA
ncbi:tagatose-6-phosphate ketose/aldose isomerase [Friedmanniella luteola]|uniref:Tagatose-6-phosphate ketose/aldose isomerase n=1 Tax=Friedmanniella luteola TaxID=546871 RepID=A0A1H1R3T1_9ACTN|nr:SIS domain-containing protein [Friedmanniella luteola]SDS30352.1 tagatose-6-phosphate ketose/aldose isomerase [Friedmanniella luteola]